MHYTLNFISSPNWKRYATVVATMIMYSFARSLTPLFSPFPIYLKRKDTLHFPISRATSNQKKMIRICTVFPLAHWLCLSHPEIGCMCVLTVIKFTRNNKILSSLSREAHTHSTHTRLVSFGKLGGNGEISVRLSTVAE